MLVYDADGLSKTRHLKQVSDPHDVLWDGNQLIVVSTDDNSVKWIDPGGDIVREWKLPAEPDSWHLNCLALHDSKVEQKFRLVPI